MPPPAGGSGGLAVLDVLDVLDELDELDDEGVLVCDEVVSEVDCSVVWVPGSDVVGTGVLLGVEREEPSDELDRLAAGFVTVVVASGSDEDATLGTDDETGTCDELLAPPRPGTVTVGPVGAVTEATDTLLAVELPTATESVGPAVAAAPQATTAGASRTTAPSMAVVDSRDRRRARMGFTVPGQRPLAVSTRRGVAHQ